MSEPTRKEMEEAFHHYFMIGPVYEDWAAWAHLFADDATYTEHFWGTFHGPDEIQQWIEPVMAAVPQIFSALMWYVIDGTRIVYQVQNWADNPEPGGAPIGFPSLQVIDYAGNGKWKSEEDWWILSEARIAARRYADARDAFDPEHPKKMTRKDWGQWIDWARPEPGRHVEPSWLGRSEIVPALRPSEISVGIRVPKSAASSG